MKHGINKCRVCDNYLRGADTCKFCHFEWATEYPPTINVPFDIFDLDDDVEWTHLQLLDRLHFKGIDCYSADMWFDNNIAMLWGCKGSKSDVARALHISEDVIYPDLEHGFMIINLFQEKYLRGMLDGDDE